jgi:hypothetical protein
MTTADALETALLEADRPFATLASAWRDWQAAPTASLVLLESDPTKLRILDQTRFAARRRSRPLRVREAKR